MMSSKRLIANANFKNVFRIHTLQKNLMGARLHNRKSRQQENEKTNRIKIILKEDISKK
jgi:hypothetical protein